MLEKLSGSASLRELVALVAGPRAWSDTRESWLARAGRRAGISYRQVKSIFYGEITDINHRSARLLRDAAEELSARYEKIARGMEAVDADFFEQDRAALIQLSRALRNLDVPRAGED